MRRRNEHTDAGASHHIGSFEGLFRAHIQTVRSFVARRVLPDEVDDVVAEAFATVWRRWHDLPDDPDLHRAWLLRTANFTLLNQRRSRGRRQALADRVEHATATADLLGAGDPYAAIPESGDTDIDAAFARLTAADQLVLTLVAWDDLTVAELAIALGCSQNAATTRLSRARARFRAVVEQLRTDG
jgi:RNA polymerase sigma-70 factor (ECF subfamily)